VVATAKRSEAQCARGLADALEELARSDDLLRQLSDGARARARTLRWPELVGSLYDDVSRRLQRRSTRAPDLTINRAHARQL
jgi:hypothetical protein